MDRHPSAKVQGAVGLVAVDLIRSVFGCGSRKRPRSKSRNVGCPAGYSRLQDSSSHDSRHCVKLTPTKAFEGRHDFDEDDSPDQEDEELPVLQRGRPSVSSDDSYAKRWISSMEHYGHRRRKGYYCMRVRILNVMRIVAMMRKVRLAYRRLKNAAAASKTILSLADLYNDIADLIPVPCSSHNDGHTIVVIRPVNLAPSPALHIAGKEQPQLPCGKGLKIARPSSTSGCSKAIRFNAGYEAKQVTSGTRKGVVDHIPSSSWRKFAFRRFSCVCTSSVTSWASPLPTPKSSMTTDELR